MLTDVKIAVLDSTSVAGIESGPGSPAYFSRFVIKYLAAHGHEIIVANTFNESLCAEADVVWSEWVTEVAYQAAASGVCKRLVLRMRGFDVHGPLHQLNWKNVNALVYESTHVRQLAESNYADLSEFDPRYVIASGLDVASIPFADRKHGLVVALVGRAVADKGYQLAFEWARQHTGMLFHMTCSLADANPRFAGYLQYAKPDNVTLHGTVDDPVKWLQRVGANYFLSASIQEAPGYAIAEAMALGIKPLILDSPGILHHWPAELTWKDFAGLNRLLHDAYCSSDYRAIVEDRLDAEKLSRAFADVLLPRL
jgi:hypothetical protein